jgi:oxygen-independent coproporphyrinogen-3 oxidase
MEKYTIKTVYIGGGTPSIIDSKYIKKILENINLKNAEEITIEVNPGTVTEKKLKDYYTTGINRISIGLQSTSNEILKKIGRIHNYEQFLETYKLARKVGFKNINIDLMIALPEQTVNGLENDLKKIIELNPEHISLYSLILEEGTVMYDKFKNREIELPNDDDERKMYWTTKEILEKNGYIHYEISNYARPTFESKHNTDCWNQKEYIGLGVSAHSYINKIRYSNTISIEEYINDYTKKKIQENQTQEIQENEYMILGLRKIEGVKISEFKNKFKENPIYIYRKELNKLIKSMLLEIDGDYIKLTNKGLDYANIVWEEWII